jgi:hypothetical protein
MKLASQSFFFLELRARRKSGKELLIYEIKKKKERKRENKRRGLNPEDFI